MGKKNRENIETEGVLCDYAQFSTKPVPVAPEKGEPVWEVKLVSFADKYRVDSILLTDSGLIFVAHGRSKIVPLSNVAYAQPI